MHVVNELLLSTDRYQQTVSHSCLYTNTVHTHGTFLACRLADTHRGEKKEKKRGVRWLKFVIQIYREMSFATYLDIAAGNHTVAYLLHNTIYTKQNQVNEMADIWRMSGQARRTCKESRTTFQCMHLSEDDGILSI